MKLFLVAAKVQGLNAKLKIGMFGFKNVYLLSPQLEKLFSEIYKGKLVYRIKSTSKKISYDRIKKELVKKSFMLSVKIPF